MRRPPISLVLGGASSGKSGWAEALVLRAERPKVYIATAEAHDREMAAKIANHKGARAGQGWRTIEAPRALAQSLAELEAEEIALIDCATFWLSNTMFGERPWRAALEELAETMAQCPAPLVIVSNEIGQGIVPADPVSRAFRIAHGEMNQRLAALSDVAVFVTAGLPQVLKGHVPW